MPILDLQQRLRELGRIRMGDKGGKGEPHKLDNFRLTSASKELLDRAGELYGGTPKEWKDAPTPGQWELYTERPTIPVLVPPGQTLSQWYEMWSGGGCQRRCDGVSEQISDQGCLCPVDLEERNEKAKDGKACRTTTRLSVVLPELPDIGVWRLESHGFYAAIELAGIAGVLEAATRGGALIPAQLRIEHRTSKKAGQTRRYIVPVLEMPQYTANQLVSAMRTGEMLPDGGMTALAPAERPSLPEPKRNGAALVDEAKAMGAQEVAAPAKNNIDPRSFWPKAKSTLRCEKLPDPSNDDIHAALGVESAYDWPGDERSALQELAVVKSLLSSGQTVAEIGAERSAERNRTLDERLAAPV